MTRRAKRVRSAIAQAQLGEDYVKGAFGFDSLELVVQRDLSPWF